MRLHDTSLRSVEAGATWSKVLSATLPRGLTPPVLTNYLELSVGGALAVGGIGGTTFRYGMQTDNVIELSVVTGDGRELVCSASSNSDLFDAVRGGGLEPGDRLTVWPATREVSRPVKPVVQRTREMKIVGQQRFDRLAILVDIGLI